MIKAGIVDGAGRAAGELVRLLVHHPDVELKWVHSAAMAGCKVSSIHQGLIGETPLSFTSELRFDEVDVLFLCTPHGESRKFVESHDIPEDMKIVDLSQDYRLAGEHDFVYGLPEINRKYIIRAKRVANPGSFATAVQLALLPLAKNLLLNSDIHITAVAGTTMAGAHPQPGQGSWCSGNIFVYKPFCHPHLAEVRQTLGQMQQSFSSEVNLIPMIGGFSRGILVSAYMDCPVSLSEICRLYEDYYSDHGFTFVSDRMPDLHDVVNTNKCLLHLSKNGGKLLAVSVIDNLLKGTAGQAVHNMNLLFGLQERTGLYLKASAF